MPNHLTSDVKAMVLAALAAEGGAEYLRRQAKDNPTAFMSLLGRILPMQVNATIAHEPHEMTDAELIAVAAGLTARSAPEEEQGSVH